MKKQSLIFLILSLVIVSACNTKKQADMIVFNAKVYTVDSTFAVQTAFAVKDGKFLAVGNKEDILENYEAESQVDAQNKFIYPGFYDAHCHFFGLGNTMQQADLVGTTSFEEIVQRLVNFQKENPDKKWLLGRGWDQNDWENKTFPNRDTLDKLFPNLPIYLVRIDGHAALANGAALQLGKIGEKPLMEGGQIDGGVVETKNGKLTGILIDNAMSLVSSVIPKPTEDEMKKILLTAQKACLENGLTTVADAGLSPEIIELIDKMHKNNELKIRVYAMVSATREYVDYYLKKGIYKTDKLNVRSFKIYADGALGSRGACMIKPYSDDPKTTGFLLSKPEELESNFQRIANSDFQANTHAIGDSANRIILNLYAKMLKGNNDRRWRIEHAQVVDSLDLMKFKNYSIIPSVQPTHCTSDMYWAARRLGNLRVRFAYAYQWLLNESKTLALGSDFPVEAVNPIFGFHSAIARQDAKNFPDNGFQMENAISREDALRGMTVWAAHANFEEKERGSIEVGKQADFIILDKDLISTERRQIRDTRFLATYVGGEKVF
ncbi:MAG: amidohydrolase [Cytophagales bacterium]|nr:MAG: amidohydrolase [Cytophagales bacterium]